MQKNKHSSSLISIPVTGGASLLVIFAVLCFTVFTLLALSTAQADNRLAQSSARAVTDYYKADQEAESILSQLRQGIIPEAVQVNNNIYSYSCPISDTQVLMVEVILETIGTGDFIGTNPTANSTSTWHILRWQAVSTVEYEDQ